MLNQKEANKFDLESEYLQSVILGDGIQRYDLNTTQTIIFPHKIVDEKYIRIPEDDLRGTNVYDYLRDHKQKLSGRKYVIDAGKKWYELWNKRQPEVQDSSKLVICNMSKSNRFAYDSEGKKTLHTTYSLVPYQHQQHDQNYPRCLEFFSFDTDIFYSINRGSRRVLSIQSNVSQRSTTAKSRV